MNTKHKAKAEAQGYIVDDTCYPWVAYKGPRFAPTEWHRVLTDKESELLAVAQSVIDEAKDGLDRSAWRLEAARAAIAKVKGGLK